MRNFLLENRFTVKEWGLWKLSIVPNSIDEIVEQCLVCVSVFNQGFASSSDRLHTSTKFDSLDVIADWNMITPTLIKL